MNHRSRSLLDLAHRLNECTNCEQWSIPGLEPAHRNGILAGKGQSIKGHDFQHAALCPACHRFYDTGARGLDPTGHYGVSREDKLALWTQAHFKTFEIYWDRGWLKVAA